VRQRARIAGTTDKGYFAVKAEDGDMEPARGDGKVAIGQLPANHAGDTDGSPFQTQNQTISGLRAHLRRDCGLPKRLQDDDFTAGTLPQLLSLRCSC
jgi:hypothetical protein